MATVLARLTIEKIIKEKDSVVVVLLYGFENELIAFISGEQEFDFYAFCPHIA